MSYSLREKTIGLTPHERQPEYILYVPLTFLLLSIDVIRRSRLEKQNLVFGDWVKYLNDICANE